MLVLCIGGICRSNDIHRLAVAIPIVGFLFVRLFGFRFLTNHHVVVGEACFLDDNVVKLDASR